MSSTIDNRIPPADAETTRMIREEVLLRPARRAAIFCVLVLAALLVMTKTAQAATFNSGAPISIGGFANANPYPAAIGVSGVTGDVTDVDVRLKGLTHGMIDDVGVVVQAPNGDSILVMNGAGNGAVSDIDLTLDDEAAQQLDNATNPATGSYRPGAYYTGDSFPAPGPGTGYCHPGPSGGNSCTLASAFDGDEAVGQWRLYVRDFLGTSSGQIARGWALELSTDGAVDVQAPQTVIDQRPADVIAASTAAFGFFADEPATYECRVDGAGFEPCSSPASFGGLAAGGHSFEVRATDLAGNVDPSPAAASFAVDVMAPRVEVGKVKVKARKRRAEIAFDARDDHSGSGALGVRCSLDGAQDRPCSSPVTLKRLRPGRHELEIVAVDEAGNPSEPAVASFKVKRRKRR